MALGGIAEGTVEAIGKRSNLSEYPLNIGAWADHVQRLRDGLATFGKDVRRAIDDTAKLNDADTADLFTEISRGVDKLLWMVEAHVQQP